MSEPSIHEIAEKLFDLCRATTKQAVLGELYAGAADTVEPMPGPDGKIRLQPGATASTPGMNARKVHSRFNPAAWIVLMFTAIGSALF